MIWIGLRVFDALINSRHKFTPYPNGTDLILTRFLAINCQATITQSLRDTKRQTPTRGTPNVVRHLPLALPEANEDAVITHLLRTVGRRSLAVVAGLGDFAEFVVRAFTAVGHARQLRKGVARAIHQQGVRCLLVITVVSLFSGLVLGLQGYYVLARFGSAGLLGTFVSLTLTRELAPVLATLMIVGQAGSAIAAEIGIYRYEGGKRWHAVPTDRRRRFFHIGL